MDHLEQKETSSALADWVVKETQGANFKDKRLTARLGSVLEMLSRKPAESIPATSNGWSETKAAYRFFDNDSVTAEKILQPHLDASIERMRDEPIVLVKKNSVRNLLFAPVKIE